MALLINIYDRKGKSYGVIYNIPLLRVRQNVKNTLFQLVLVLGQIRPFQRYFKYIKVQDVSNILKFMKKQFKETLISHLTMVQQLLHQLND